MFDIHSIISEALTTPPTEEANALCLFRGQDPVELVDVAGWQLRRAQAAQAELFVIYRTVAPRKE